MVQKFRNILHFLPLVVTAGLLQLQPLHAGTTGKIAGKVIDAKSQEPLTGVNVLIAGTSMGNVSRPDGEFFILNVPPGTYTVRFSILGYSAATRKNVTVLVDQTTRLELAMTPAELEGEDVVVVAQRPVVEKDVTASVQIVDAKSMERSWVRTVRDAVESQTGIFSVSPSLGWTRGQTTAFIRGSSIVQATYMIDNLSVNSGLLSDNYSGFNTSTIQEISVQTGGYNAEYGEARSAVVNIVSKEASSGLHGSALVRMRPAGTYHFGRDFYSHDNYDWRYFDQDYWTRQATDPLNAEFFGRKPDSLLAAWRRQITPNDTLANYNQRAEYELESTLYGALYKNLTFLISGRYKRAVDIFPQAIPYNPEHNFQGYLNYAVSPAFKLRLGGFIGGWETADYPSVNYNTGESAQEADWLAPMRVDEQYARAKYNPWGAIYRFYPELRKWSQIYLKATHVLNPQSFYEITASYLKDDMDRSDRNDVVPDSLWARRDDVQKMVNRFLDAGYYQCWSHNYSTIYQIKGDYTNQVTPHHLLKTGAMVRKFDFFYESFQGVFEGGNRWNLLNVFAGRPYEGAFYLQDKIEVPGLVINAGFRGDFFNQNRDAAKHMFDPLAFLPTTPGHDPAKPVGYPGKPETERTRTQFAFAPRLGISHPISDKSVLRFVYGHFYQRPSWTKMFGLPFVNYTEDVNTVLDPYANQITYMEEWQGYYGNPRMSYERTIQYELGFDSNIRDRFKLSLTGYYKDATREATVVTGIYPNPALYSATKALMVSNSGYSDVRGIETKLDSRFNGFFNFGISHDMYWSAGGEVGYRKIYEPGSANISIPKGMNQYEGVWSSFHKVKGFLNLFFDKGYGPQVWGCTPLSDLNIYLYTWWRSGEPYTYHAPGDISTEPNNRRWFSYYQTNLKVAKGVTFGSMRTELSVEVKNLFNSKFLVRLGGDDMVRWQENPDLPEKERLPRNWFSNEYDEWSWYSYEVPPRQVYLQAKVEF